MGLAPFFWPVCQLRPGGTESAPQTGGGLPWEAGLGTWLRRNAARDPQNGRKAFLRSCWPGGGQMQPQLTPAPRVPYPRRTDTSPSPVAPLCKCGLGYPGGQVNSVWVTSWCPHPTPGAEGTVNSLLGAQALSQHVGHRPQQQHVGLLGGVPRTSHGDPRCPPASGSQLQSAGASWLARTGAGSSPSRWSG